MAQSGFTPIQLYRSATPSAAPSAGNLAAGELAINTADGILFYEDSGGVVQVLATKNSAAGTFTNLAYTGTLTGGTGVINIGSGQIYKDASGAVGIGTTSPLAFLDVRGVVQSNSGYYVSGNAGGGFLFTRDNTPLRFGTNDIERLRIDPAGNAGLGVAPSAWGGFRAFQVGLTGVLYTAGGETYLGDNHYFDGSVYRYLTSQPATRFKQISGNISWDVAPSGTAGNPITFTQAMTLTQGGNLLVGTTTEFAKLSVNGGIYAAAGNDIQVGNINNSNAASINSDSADTSASLVFKTAAAGLARTERARITSDGNLLLGTTIDVGARALVFGNFLSVKDNLYSGFFGKASDLVSGGAATDVALRSDTSLLFSTSGGLERARITSAGFGKFSNTGSDQAISGLSGQYTGGINHAFFNSDVNYTVVAGNSSAGISTAANFGSFLNSGSAHNHFRALTNSIAVYQVLANGNVQGAAGSVSAPAYSTIGDTNSGIYFPLADQVGIATAGIGRVIVTATGNVLINTTTAGTHKLRVVSAADVTYQDTALFTNESNAAVQIQLRSNQALISTVASSTLLGIGTGSALGVLFNDANYLKMTSGSLVSTAGLFHEMVQNDTAATNQVRATWHRGTVGDNLFETFYTEGTATARGSIDYNRAGGAVRYNTTSDGNLKNIKGEANKADSVALIMSIPIDEWAWKDDPQQWSQIGPIAQKLNEVFPGAVSVGGEYKEKVPAVTEQRLVSEAVIVDGEEVEPASYETVIVEPEKTVTKYRPWAVDKTAPVWHLVATCQTQQVQIKKQQDTIDSLIARIEALEAK